MDLRKHTRRDFIRLTGLTVAGVTIAACAAEPEVVEKIVQETVIVEKEVEKEVTVEVEKEVTVEKEVEATPLPSKYKESPMLAARVAKGELPPVEERLPEEPRVVQVFERIGDYGGTLRTGGMYMTMGGADAGQASGPPNFLRISPEATHALPNTLKHWEVSDDLKEVTCYLRKGMKWSDGQPVTTEDIRYFYEDMLNNTEITPVPHMSFRWGGEMMRLTIIDDYTFKLTFAAPHPSFVLVNMAHQYGYWGNHWVPAHFLKQYHIKYNPDADQLAKDAGLDFWYQLHGRQNDAGYTLDRPVVGSMMNVRDTPTTCFQERNPYYHAVDPEGNQLPYIDKFVIDRCADLSVFDAKVVGGNFDFAAFELRILFYATYAEGAAASDARMLIWPSGKGGEAVYNVNMNWPDEEWREVFSDDRFRQALSLAINRADINNVIYFGNASETQFTVVPVSRHYKPEYAAAYAEFDLERANALLDEMGLEWDDAHVHRLWPVSKQPIIIPWDLVETETPKGPITELVTEYWKKIGVEIQWKSITRTLLTQKILANEEPMSTWHGDETMDTLFLRRPKFFAPIDGDESCWAVLWGRWYNTGGEQGEEPPQMIKDLYNWMDDYMLTDSDESAASVLQSQAEHIWTINSVGNAPHPLFVRNNLRNVSETGGFWTWDSLWVHTEYAEQWFLEA